MKRFVEVPDPAALAGWETRAGLPALDAAQLVRDAPDAHWILVGDDGSIAGRFSLWWRRTPPLPGHRPGIIGHYASDGAASGSALLGRACEELAARHCTVAIGPMDGDTWRQYRFVTGGDEGVPFFLEPANPPEWPLQFAAHGLEPLARYCSAVDEDLAADDDPQAKRAADRLAGEGIRLRSLDPARIDEELRSIHGVVTASFRGGFLYHPLSEAEFAALYAPVLPRVRPELVTIAMQGNRPVGFVFTLPDVLQGRAGGTIDTAIVKTLAVLPGRCLAGLGSHLVAENRRAARALGFRRLIHALMHDANKSRGISARQARVFRRYTLFAKPL